ncbi:MAG: hypothetical protein A2X82_00565 [Geobacteraceae bacterium GWC2_55_20]|nr:MAG: hypothetical protein A2X82_00565 [Geobacteraceae bacterium GWC2_55_20]OGU24556.1 MAG: hypothetical protein A2X85_07655 [Geobacteraceae bacterium GWF2_54_21]HBA73615.1 hypothetical protein [Geobacter sp.]HCE69178.1 hypothetical protein [Geobacter sp.]
MFGCFSIFIDAVARKSALALTVQYGVGIICLAAIYGAAGTRLLCNSDELNVITHAETIEKAMPATSARASNRSNTHYVIRGTSTSGVEVYCKVCSNYHLHTNEFIEWKLTSFTIN